ncbi:hypothetical protein HC766_00585 [Candidatus Gracilibacteria bacterium]|nr:hypothetical protein [Thermales bacterium]NJL97225.1 hypothetical protein [Candidatus Gracilibacteria bacterium]NJS40885.1 hypothetical protein [Candidatus Gracilibacteria bacterium]
MSDNYYNQDSNYGYTNETPTRKKVNFFEIGIIVVSVLGVIITFAIGFNTQAIKNRDEQRFADINNVVIALDNYYLNSSVNPSSRTYPVANCSFDLNEVDFEFTLREQLTGMRLDLDTHAYIKPDDFPKDNWGVYSQNLNQRKLPYRCSQNLSGDSSDSIYKDEYPSCNFSSTAEKRFRQCYIYTSSNNGDTYQIGYYSEVDKQFIVYRKFRETPIEFVR